jgi:hypothetical protein
VVRPPPPDPVSSYFLLAVSVCTIASSCHATQCSQFTRIPINFTRIPLLST